MVMAMTHPTANPIVSGSPALIDQRIRKLILLAPILFLLHEAEEAIATPIWLSHNLALVPAELQAYIPTRSMYILAALGFFAVTAIAGQAALAWRRELWYVFALIMTARLANGIAHIGLSVALMRYTPGLLTGVVIIVPVCALTLAALIRAGHINRRSLLWLAPVGFLVQLAAIAVFI